ncbi:MAG TPA: RNA polymerase sigma-70 factor [Bacteroidales bacterium]|nr:RNA polymerase sigma-70 factor [Bacteroidales bacterium]
MKQKETATLDTNSLNELTLKVTEGDEDAFARLYDLYFPKVYRFTKCFIKQEEICEEIVSDVFLNLWINKRELSQIINLDAYLYIVARNKAYNHLNKIQRSPEFTIDLPLDFEENGNPEEIVLTDELKDIITKSVDELPDKCKLVFLLSREKNLKYKDIAQILSISEKTVNAQIVTALKKLHSSLRHYLSCIL